MFEKLITDLKKSLPAPIRKKMGIDAEENEENGDNSPELNDSSYEEGAAEGEVSSDEEKKKKQKSMIIKVVVIVALGYVALDEFVLKGMNSGDESVEAMLAKAPVRKKRQRPKVETPPVTEAPGAATTTEVPPTGEVAQTGSETPPTTPTESTVESTTPEVPPVENINIAQKTETPTEPQTQIETPATEIVPQVGESKTPEVNMDQKIDQMINTVDESDPKTETKVEPKPSMADKIVEDAVETAPPAYDQVGRGLVYNCKDKYWACLDKPAYVTCNKNMKWNKSKGNSAECVVQSIYASDEDCAKIQKYNVSTSQPTAFCQ